MRKEALTGFRARAFQYRSGFSRAPGYELPISTAIPTRDARDADHDYCSDQQKCDQVLMGCESDHGDDHDHAHHHEPDLVVLHRQIHTPLG